MWKKNLIYAAAICLALVIQVSVLPAFFPARSVPQIMLMLAVAGTVIFGFSRMLPWIMLSGLLLDFISYANIGTSVILFVFVSYVVSFYSRRFLVESKVWGILIMIFFAAGATIIHCLFVFIVDFINNGFQKSPGVFGSYFSAIVPGIIYNIILLFLCFWALDSLKKSKVFRKF